MRGRVILVSSKHTITEVKFKSLLNSLVNILFWHKLYKLQSGSDQRSDNLVANIECLHNIFVYPENPFMDRMKKQNTFQD